MKKIELIESINELNFEENLKIRLIGNIESTSDDEELENAYVILNIIKLIEENYQNEVLKGAHVFISDNGYLYDFLREVDFLENRQSSHHKNNKADSDASMQAGEIFREFLIGKTNTGKTWFQLEAHSLGGFYNFIAHGIDFIAYKCTSSNVGQYGYSKYVDTNPIYLNELYESDNNDNVDLIGNI
jgi:hypothetical protein